MSREKHYTTEWLSFKNVLIKELKKLNTSMY